MQRCDTLKAAGEVFQLVEDVVETNTTENIKTCFSFMEQFWGELRTNTAKLTQFVRLRFQKACNMFTKRVSNNQDAEVLGAVALQVAKMLPFNDRAGINATFLVNQHETPMDEEAGVCTHCGPNSHNCTMPASLPCMA